MKNFLFFILAALLLTVPCRAESLMDEARSAVPESVREVTGETDDGAGMLARLWQLAKDELRTKTGEGLRTGVKVTVVVLLTGLGTGLCPGEKAEELCEICAVCVLCSVLAGDVDSLLRETTQTIRTLADYAELSLPVLFTASAIAAPTSSAAVYAGACMGIDLLMELSGRLLVPLIYAYLALVCAGAVFRNTVLTGLSRLVKWTAGTLMAVSCLVFTLYLSVTGLISGSVDAAAAKAVKTGISTVLPVVGGIIADASTAVLAAAGALRTSVGVLGLICVCALCVSPFVRLGVQALLLKGCAAAAQSFSGARTAELLSGFGTALSLSIGLLGSFALMLFISIMAAVKAVGL